MGAVFSPSRGSVRGGAHSHSAISNGGGGPGHGRGNDGRDGRFRAYFEQQAIAAPSGIVHLHLDSTWVARGPHISSIISTGAHAAHLPPQVSADMGSGSEAGRFLTLAAQRAFYFLTQDQLRNAVAPLNLNDGSHALAGILRSIHHVPSVGNTAVVEDGFSRLRNFERSAARGGRARASRNVAYQMIRSVDAALFGHVIGAEEVEEHVPIATLRQILADAEDGESTAVPDDGDSESEESEAEDATVP